jgi:predicted CoA-binding protein
MARHPNILEDDARIGELVRSSKRVAVLGIRSEKYADRAAHYVAKYVHDRGAEVIPVPVYEPDAKEILGAKVVRHLSEIEGPVDIVDVFRKSSDIPAHVAEIKALKPRAAWFQLGIVNDEAARELAEAGILVVQDHCLKVEWGRHRS